MSCQTFLTNAANPGFQSLLQMLSCHKHTILHLIPFGSLLFAAISKDQTKDSKLDARAVRCIFIGFGVVENKKCVMAYTLNPTNPYKIGTVIDTVSYKSDPTYFPYRKGQERILSLSGSTPSAKEIKEYLEDIPIFHDEDQWKDALISLNSGPLFTQASNRSLETTCEVVEPNPTQEARDNGDQKKALLIGYDAASDRWVD